MFKKALVGVLVLLLVVVFLLVKDYDSPELGQKLLDQAGEATGIEMSATGFRFNLFKGVELQGVTARSHTEDRELDFTLDRLVFEHRLLPLLSGTVAIDRIVLEKPEFTLVESAPPEGREKEEEEAEEAESAPAAEGGEEAGGGLALEVQQILVKDGTVVVRQADGSGETRVEGFDLTMENVAFDPAEESLKALSGEGELAIDRIALDTMTLTDTESRFRLADGVFDLDELRFDTDHGAFHAEARVDFNPVPFTYTMSAEGDPLDLNGMVAASGSEGFGPATVKLEAEGKGAETKDVSAKGGLQLAAGSFPAVKMFEQVDQALGKSALVGADYEATEATFTLENNVVRLAPFRFTSDAVRLDLEGTVSLEGPIALRFSVAAPREGVQIQGVGASALDVLADDAGWVPVPMTVTGTLEDPKVRPDTKALLAQVRGGAKRQAKQKAAEAAGEALSGLFGRKKKK